MHSAFRTVAMLIIALAIGLPLSAAQPVAVDAAEQPEYAVQLIYAIPEDGEDRELDLDGTILNSVESAQEWLEEETDGQRLNLVSDEDGTPTIELFDLSRTEKELMTHAESDASFQIEYELRAAGFDKPGMLYAIYYEGAANDDGVCGATPSPEFGPSNSATLFLQSGCDVFPLVDEGEDANFWELTLLHELFHAFGAVENCAPNNNNGHVDEANDLMFGEAEPWIYPVHLDVDHDDYYGHGRHACYDTARSPYLAPEAGDAEPYPTPFADIAVNSCAVNAGDPGSERVDAEVWIINLSDDPIDLEWLSPTGGTESLGTVDSWTGTVLTSIPGDTFLINGSDGDCLGSFLMPDFLDIGVVWIEQ